MENNVLKMIKYLYYFSLIILFVLYLFPGSLIGHLLYGDLGKQPNIIDNPIGTSINHLIFFMYLSSLGLIVRSNAKSFFNSFYFLLGISILLELLHLIVPNRAFEYYDLFANSVGVVTVYFIWLIYLKFNILN